MTYEERKILAKLESVRELFKDLVRKQDPNAEKALLIISVGTNGYIDAFSISKDGENGEPNKYYIKVTKRGEEE